MGTLYPSSANTVTSVGPVVDLKDVERHFRRVDHVNGGWFRKIVKR